MGHIWGFVRTDADNTDRWWAGAGSVLFKASGTDPTAGWAQDAIITGDGTPTDLSHLFSDMVEFEGDLIVSTSTDLHRLASGSWDQSWWDTTLAQTALTSTIYHPLATWERTLLIGDANVLHIVDRNNVVTASRVTLPPEFYIMKIISSPSRIWILTRHIYNGEAMIFEWDGKANSYFRQHSALAPQCLSGVVSQKEIPYVMNSNGQLLKFTGSGFDEKARLPVYTEEATRNQTDGMISSIWGDSWSLDRMVHNNGMAIIDGQVHILLSGAINGTDNTLMENMNSGVWIYSEENGFYHAYSLTQFKATYNDYGTGVILYPGAIIQTSPKRFLSGGTIYTDNMTTELSAIYNKSISSSPTNSRRSGYIIFNQLTSSEIQNIWDKIWLKFSQMKVSTDKIIVKKRVIKDYNLPLKPSITWTSTTTFTTTLTDFNDAAVGDEVNVIVGPNSGLAAHITNISEAAGTYTVTIDETALSGSGTGQAYVYDWVKVGSFSDTSLEKQYIDFALGGESTKLDIKIVFIFTDEQQFLEEVVITGKKNQVTE